MKFLIFSPYYPPHSGGLESHSEEFNEHISSAGENVVVLTPHLPKDTSESEEKNNVKIIRFPAFEIISNYPIPKFWLPKFWHILSIARNSEPDIIISRTRFFTSSLLALICAKIWKIPLIHIEHGSDFVQLSNPFTSFIAKCYDNVFGRILFRSSDKNISISKAVQAFVRKFDKRDSPVIYRGIDFDIIESIQKNLEISKKYPDKIILSTAARLYKWKGIENSIEAIRMLSPETKEKILLFIIGDGEDFERLEKLSRGLPIKLIGNIPRKDVIGMLKSSDIYIHSSFPGGGLSTSLLEAMYCGCAVIATPNEGADEVVSNEKNGILLSESNSKTIRDAIENLIVNSSLAKQLGNQASIDIREQFEWENSIKEYKDIFTAISKV